MKHLNVLGIDIAKHSFQLHGADREGNKVLSKACTPEKAAALIANLPKCLIGMEACGSSHFWARTFRAMSHDVKLIPPQYVRAFVIGNHNDVKDAEGISEAVRRKSIRFVPIKEQSHQDIQNIHRIRQRLIKNRIELSNQIRGILYEYNIKFRQGDTALKKHVIELLDVGSGISDLLRVELQEAYLEFLDLEKRVQTKTLRLERLAKENDECKRLMTIPGVGPMIATATISSVANAKEFHNGRSMSAWLGLVPGHHHTGGPMQKTIMKGITKRGNRYLRTLFIQGARAWLVNLSKYKGKRAEWADRLVKQKGFNKAAVAIANKNVRIACVLLKEKQEYLAAKAA